MEKVCVLFVITPRFLTLTATRIQAFEAQMNRGCKPERRQTQKKSRKEETFKSTMNFGLEESKYLLKEQL